MNLPAHVYAVKDRHGRTRYRFRRKGLPSRYVHGVPFTAEFHESYQRCLAPDRPDVRRSITRKIPRFTLSSLKGVEVVYFLAGSRGPVKIGTTVNILGRLKKLQTGNPLRLRILALVTGGVDVELAYHAALAEHRTQGEWFDRTAALAIVKSITDSGKCLTLHPAKWSNLEKRQNSDAF